MEITEIYESILLKVFFIIKPEVHGFHFSNRLLIFQWILLNASIFTLSTCMFYEQLQQFL